MSLQGFNLGAAALQQTVTFGDLLLQVRQFSGVAAFQLLVARLASLTQLFLLAQFVFERLFRIGARRDIFVEFLLEPLHRQRQGLHFAVANC